MKHRHITYSFFICNHCVVDFIEIANPRPKTDALYSISIWNHIRYERLIQWLLVVQIQLASSQHHQVLLQQQPFHTEQKEPSCAHPEYVRNHVSKFTTPSLLRGPTTQKPSSLHLASSPAAQRLQSDMAAPQNENRDPSHSQSHNAHQAIFSTSDEHLFQY